MPLLKDITASPTSARSGPAASSVARPHAGPPGPQFAKHLLSVRSYSRTGWRPSLSLLVAGSVGRLFFGQIARHGRRSARSHGIGAKGKRK